MSAYNIGILVGIAVAMGIFAVIAAFNKKRGKPGEFDERQELIRGKAYQHAFFAVESIARDAFFTAKNRPKSYIILYITAIFSQIVNAVGNIRDGGLVRGGVLTMHVLPLVCAVVFAIILLAIIVKTVRKPKEEDDE